MLRTSVGGQITLEVYALTEAPVTLNRWDTASHWVASYAGWGPAYQTSLGGLAVGGQPFSSLTVSNHLDHAVYLVVQQSTGNFWILKDNPL